MAMYLGEEKGKQRIKIVTGDTIPKRITIEKTILGNKQERDTDKDELKQNMETNHEQDGKEIEEVEENELVCTLEMRSDEGTPKTITEALRGEDKELWKKSAIAEVNNFLKRGSWRFVTKEAVAEIERTTIGVKWVFKIKDEPDYTLN